MKKYLIAILIAGITNLISCEDQLDIPQQGVQPVDATYSNADDEAVNQFIAAIYYKIRGHVYTDNFVGTTTSAWSFKYHLERMGGDFGDYYLYVDVADSPIYTKIWSYHYSIIYWCNMIVENFPKNNVASATVKNRIISEARVIRAIMMMNLVQLWGTPPLADHIMTGEEGNTPAEDSWVFIERELNEAAEGLPSKKGLDGQSEIGGRLTKEAAYAYLGKACLWQKKYNEAASILYSKVIATGLYELVPDLAELNRYTSDFCSEYLWECDINPEYPASQAGMMDALYSNWDVNEIFFPDNIYNAGGWGNVAYASESFGAFMDLHDKLGNGSKSKRYRAFLATYEDLLDETLFSYSDQNKGVKPQGISKNEGYFRVKLIPRWENIMGGEDMFTQYMHNNFVYMKYSEVLLNYAEAIAMGGTAGTLSGLDALNLVRNRAGLSLAPTLDMNNIEYGVKAERRAELFFEGIRFIDLVRWGEASSVLAECGKYNPVFYGYIDGATQQNKDNWRIVKNPQ
ncbi:MAG: RagB/SusD family nutrient uptake outer membrane protein, partial [Tannerellaceae bacterium]|nr:RagB/SusD family nutrient uptake outer membrane protein [Tannerellaceae bacterium]